MNFLDWVSQMLIAPTEPSRPFGDVALIITDTLRVIIILIGVAVIALTPLSIVKAILPGQRVRLAVLGLFTLSAVGTEINHIGDYSSWQLVVHILAITGTAWGLWSFYCNELPTQVKLTPDPLHYRMILPPLDSDDNDESVPDHQTDEGNAPCVS